MIDLNLTQRTSGPDLVLFLHGLGCSGASFAAAFAEGALPGYSLLTPDLPGFGDSPALSWEHTIEDHASAVRELLLLLLTDHFCGARPPLLGAQRTRLSPPGSR